MIASATSPKRKEHRWQKGQRLTAAWVQQVHDFVFGLKVTGGSLSWVAGKPRLMCRGIEDKMSFAWSIVDDSGTSKLKIGEGWVEHHEPDGSTEYYNAPEVTNIALAEGENVVYVEYTIKSGAATSATVSTDTTQTLALNGVDDTDTILKIPLGCWNQTATGAISLTLLYHRGNIKIFPLFAA